MSTTIPRLVIDPSMATNPWAQMSRIGAYARELHVAAGSDETPGVQTVTFEVEYPPNAQGEVGVDRLVMDENGQLTEEVIAVSRLVAEDAPDA